MKKIIIGVFVLALLVSTTVSAERRGGRERRIGDENTATSTRSEMRDRIKNKNATSTRDVDETCVSAAIEVREEALADAWDAFSLDVAATLDARKVAFVDAWKITDAKERKVAVKKAWDTAKKERKAAALEYKTEKKNTWAEFKKEAKTCGAGVGSEASGESEAGEKVEI